MQIKIIVLVGFLFLFSCKEQEARRPVVQKTTNIYKQVVEQSKKINAFEESAIKAFITKDSINTYINSSKGFWYYYNVKKEESVLTPNSEDVVTLSYDIQDLQGNIIYTKEALGILEYVVDKQDFIPALQEGIKLMKVGETVTFVIPSYNAFGVVGDENKIGINQIIKSTVTLIDIKTKNKNENN